MKGFEEVKKIPAIPFSDHSQGIISGAPLGASEESAAAPRQSRLCLSHTRAAQSPGGLGVPVTLSSLGHLGNASKAVLEGIPSLTAPISPREGMVHP